MVFSSPELLTTMAVLLISAWLARSASPGARIALWASALLISAGMFLPSSLLRALVGPGLLAVLTQDTSAIPGGLEAFAHFIAFLWLALMVWTMRPDLRGWKVVVALVVLAVAGELMQGLTTERSPREDDVMVNLIGAASGLLLAKVVDVARRARSRSRTDGF